MKKQSKKLSLSKRIISEFNSKSVKGGKGPQTFLAEGCGTSVNHSDCICYPRTYFADTCGSCY